MTNTVVPTLVFKGNVSSISVTTWLSKIAEPPKVLGVFFIVCMEKKEERKE